MAKATEKSLTVRERELMMETHRDHLRTLSEDDLASLLVRVRKARDKFVQLHRREVAQHVDEAGARGVASKPPRRSASKAELFEDALARVSSALAKAARESAKALRAERLAMAAGQPVPGSEPTPRAEPAVKAGRPKATRTPATQKEMASHRAQGARRQAKRDSR